MLEVQTVFHEPAHRTAEGGVPPAARCGPAGPEPLRIGLLNNMPDAALAATERQFRRLLEGSGRPVRLSLFALDAIERGPAARARLAADYASHRALAQAGLDALVITGCEPRAGRLDAEPYFPAFAEVVDWAARHTRSTLFSCLAAHAAVLHLDGIARRPLADKLWGVFPCTQAAPHPLLAGATGPVPVPHSRWNDLPEADLTARGYRVLRRSEAVGADLFVRTAAAGSLFVFLQGHPEYDGDSLAREHRRDLGRYLTGERADCPPLPENYFSAAAARALEAVTRAVLRGDLLTPADLPALDPSPPLQASWQAEAARLFGAWLDEVARRRAAAEAAVTAA